MNGKDETVEILETADTAMVNRAIEFASSRNCNNGEGPCVRCVVQFARQEVRRLTEENRVMEEALKRVKAETYCGTAADIAKAALATIKEPPTTHQWAKHEQEIPGAMDEPYTYCVRCSVEQTEDNGRCGGGEK